MRYKRLSDGVVMDEREFTSTCHDDTPDSYCTDCRHCPLNPSKDRSGLSCRDFMVKHPIWSAYKLGFEPIRESDEDEGKMSQFYQELQKQCREEKLKEDLETVKQWLEERGKEHEEDMVNQPAHYTSGGIECADALDAMVSAYPDPNAAALAWQVGKYIWRHPLKWNPLEDLKKARWYLDRLIAHYEKKEADNGA